jgi:hypothetical protein
MCEEDYDMAAPTPTLYFKADLGDLDNDVQAIKDAIGTPTRLSNPIAQIVEGTKTQLGSAKLDDVAKDAKDAAAFSSGLQNAVGAIPGSDIATAISTLGSTTDALKTAIGDPTRTGDTIVSIAEATKAQLGSVSFTVLANDAGAARIAATSLQGTLGSIAGKDFATAITAIDNRTTELRTAIGHAGPSTYPPTKTIVELIGTPQGGRALADVTETIERKLDELKKLTIFLWWIDHCYFFIDKRDKQSIIGHVCEHLNLQDQRARSTVTKADLETAARFYKIPDALIADLDDVVELVKDYK